MKYELLLPAGNLEKFKIACLYGADAVYFGGYDYNMRANTNNFSIDDIKEASEYAHKLNKKIYVTVNMIFHNDDLKGLDEYLIKLNELKVDAVIVSDFAVIEAIKRLILDTPFFVSCQKSITNLEAVKFYKSLGAQRVVLARECTKDDITNIKNNVDMELAVFIHGAMCTSYSGRCILSNYINKRDSNRGGCAQICRFAFNNGFKNDFTIASKDLNMIDYIGDMMDQGIESYKIEGRMKSLYYIATVANAYRIIMDKKQEGTIDSETIKYYKKILERCSNRENIPQFYNGLPGVEGEYFIDRNEVNNQDFLGLIIDYDKNTKMATLEQRNKFNVGDTVQIFGPRITPTDVIIEEIVNSKGENIKSAIHAQEVVKIKVPFEVHKYDIMRVKIS